MAPKNIKQETAPPDVSEVNKKYYSCGGETEFYYG